MAHIKHVEFTVVHATYSDVPVKSSRRAMKIAAMIEVSELTREQQEKLPAIVKRTLTDIKDYAVFVLSQFRVHDIEETGGCAVVRLHAGSPQHNLFMHVD